MKKQGVSAKISNRKKKMNKGSRYFAVPHIMWFASIVPAMLFLTAISFIPSAAKFWQTHVTTFFSPLCLQTICVSAWLAHFGEASYAFFLARKLSLTMETQFQWLAQTCTLGYPSLRLLLAHKRSRESSQ